MIGIERKNERGGGGRGGGGREKQNTVKRKDKMITLKGEKVGRKSDKNER